jgi:hypothetical protein
LLNGICWLGTVMKDRTVFLFLALIAALALITLPIVRTPFIQALLGNWDFVKSVRRDTGTFYRLNVKLTYKGEPQVFDIVVACDWRQINYMDGGRTVEVGLTPSVFGRRMSDGRGLVVRPPRACRGETTENGDVAPDLLPVVVVYDDAETLAFGTAYLSDDAYNSPLSVLKFGGAAIERADRAAFEQFRREQPNLVSRSSFHTPSGFYGLKQLGLPAARIPMGTGCFGYARFRLFGAEKARAHDLWPADRPRFWRPATQQDHEAINPHQYGRPVLTDREGAVPHPSNLVMSQLDVETPNQGLPRVDPAAWSKHEPRLIAPSYYPDIGGWIALPWPADAAARAEALFQAGPHVGASIDFRDGAMRGFGYCRPAPPAFPTGVAYADQSKIPSIPYVNLPQINFVDGTEVTNPYDGLIGPSLIVERDEFIFVKFGFGLGSTRGDV